jgi:hypothetical protein
MNINELNLTLHEKIFLIDNRWNNLMKTLNMAKRWTTHDDEMKKSNFDKWGSYSTANRKRVEGYAAEMGFVPMNMSHKQLAETYLNLVKDTVSDIVAEIDSIEKRMARDVKID